MQRVVNSIPALVAIAPALIHARWLEATTSIPAGYDYRGDPVVQPGSATNWTDWVIPTETLALRNFYDEVTGEDCSNNIIRDPRAILDTIVYWRYDVNPGQNYFINRLEIHAGSDCNDNDPYIIGLDSIDGYGNDEVAEELIQAEDNMGQQADQIVPPGYKGRDFWEAYYSSPDRAEGQAGLAEEDSGIFGSEIGPYKRLAKRSPQAPYPDSEENKSDAPPPQTNANNNPARPAFRLLNFDELDSAPLNNDPTRPIFRQLNFDEVDTAPVNNDPIGNLGTNNPFNFPSFNNFRPSTYQPQPVRPQSAMLGNPLQQTYGGYLMGRIRSAPTDNQVFEANPYERNGPTGQQSRAFRRLSFESDKEAPQGGYSRIDLRPQRNQAEMITFEEGVQENPFQFNPGTVPILQPANPAFRRLNFEQEAAQFEDMSVQQDNNVGIEDPQNLLGNDASRNQGALNAINFLRNGGTYLEDPQSDLYQDEDLPPNDGQQRLFIADLEEYNIGGDISFRFVIDPLVVHSADDQQQQITFAEAQQQIQDPNQPNTA
ncbi:hypothetical protein ABW21_db0203138 [Orbilia brochopaga]|nr:hypothetical protein ABW21_db0203138 [Drechslerella brochopaga]